MVWAVFQEPALNANPGAGQQATRRKIKADTNSFRPMVRIKSATDALDFKSPARHANGSIFEICVHWRNAEGGLKDKQMGDFILAMGLNIAMSIISSLKTI